MNRFTDLRDKVLPMLRPYVKRIDVFGSFARGEETPESDIDILVELKDPEKRPRLGLGWFGLEEELSRILGREVELIAEGSLRTYWLAVDQKQKAIPIGQQLQFLSLNSSYSLNQTTTVSDHPGPQVPFSWP